MFTIPAQLAVPVQELPDHELWSQFSALGTATRTCRQRFLALLPEVSRRRLHRRKSFPSLLACAQQLAGVSADVVHRVLGLHERLRAFPGIWRLIERAEVGWSVVARVPAAMIEADPQAWERSFVQLSKREIEALVQAHRAPSTPSSEAPVTRPLPQAARTVAPANPRERRLQHNASHDPSPEPSPVLEPEPELAAQDPTGSAAPSSHRSLRAFLHVTPDEAARLDLLLQDHQRRTGEASSLSELLTQLVRATWLADPAIPVTAATSAAPPIAVLAPAPSLPEPPSKALYRQAVESAGMARGQQPPPLVVRFVRARARNLCERAGCRSPGVHIHHLHGRSGDRPHHPDKLALLCETCHGLLHQGRVENPADPPHRWRLRAPGAAPKTKARDRRYQRHRKRATRTDRRLAASAPPARPSG